VGEGREVQVYTWALLIPGDRSGGSVSTGVHWLSTPCDIPSSNHLVKYGPLRVRGSPTPRKRNVI